MNDGLEIKWGYAVWIEVANNLIGEFGFEFIDEIDKVIHGFGFHSLIISSSFSMKGDILSQWRAYASDGNGYCVGFKAKDIFNLPIYPIKIIYNKKEQFKKATDSVRIIHLAETRSNEKFGKDFFEFCFFFATELASMKNPSFEEEKEIRTIHLLTFKPSNKSLKLIDVGGTSFGVETSGQEIKYRFRDDCPIAYQDYNFTNDGKINPIKEVILGPKNKSLPTGISVYLETLGFDNVKILKSKLSYV